LIVEGSDRERVNVSDRGPVKPGGALEARLVPRGLLWSIQFSKDGTPLPPEPPPPSEDCPEDSACDAPSPPPPPDETDCSSTRACLNSGKFWVGVDYYDGVRKGAKVLTTAALPDTAAIFWFFDANNPELLVKVVNGCRINGHWWVFGSAATDLDYDIVVGRRNQDGTRFRLFSPSVPLRYTSAFRCLSGE